MIPTLLIPGLAATATLFEGQIDALNAFGPVHVADHRGAQSMHGLATRILADAPAQFRLCGLSMGGYLAFEIMRQAPERVTRLVLMDTSARPDTEESRQKRMDAIAVAKNGGYTRLIKEGIPNLVTPAHAQDEQIRQVIIDMAERCGADGYIDQQLANAGRVDSRELLSSIKIPTLVLVGEHDTLTPEDLATEIAMGIGEHAELEVISAAGHLTPIEQPLAVRAALTDFFSAA